MKVLEREDVLVLLREAVKSIGGQTAWAKAYRLDRSSLNKTLRGRIAPSKSLLSALKLRVVYTFKPAPKRAPAAAGGRLRRPRR